MFLTKNQKLMKIFNVFRTALFIAIIGLLSGCQFSSKREYRVISVENAVSAYNISDSHPYFGILSKSEENPEVKLLVSPGDLINIMTDSSEGELQYRYKKGDPLKLSIHSENDALYINGKRAFFEVSDSLFESEFDNLEPDVLNSLEYIAVDGEITEAQFVLLEKI